jgi:hypothetical protein
MIDRAGRDAAAAALEGFRSGMITNEEFEDKWPSTSSEPALFQIREHLLPTYDETSEYKLSPSSIGRERDELYRRVILFLRSSEEYRWPYVPRSGLMSLLLAIATLGVSRLVSLPRRLRFRRSGDIPLWPFVTEEDFHRVSNSSS